MEAKSICLFNERGFTLIEVLVSMAILAIALIPMAEILSNSLSNSVSIEYKARTAFLAQMKLEETKAKTIAHFIYGDDGNYDGNIATAFSAPDTAYKYTVIISNVIANEIKLIQVNVWYDKNTNGSIDEGEQETVLYTKVARRG